MLEFRLKQYSENFAFLILRIFELFTREVRIFLERCTTFYIFCCFCMFVNRYFIYLGCAQLKLSKNKYFVRRQSFVRSFWKKDEKAYLFLKRWLQMWQCRMVFERSKFVKANVSCQMPNKVTSCSDEELAEKIKQCPVLYDKSHSHFRRKDLKSNA